MTSLTTWTKRVTRDDVTRISRAINRALLADLLMLKQQIDLREQSDKRFEWSEDEWAQQLAVSGLVRVETVLALMLPRQPATQSLAWENLQR